MADSPQPIVVYLAHPVGAVDAAGVEQNLRHARRWLRWLIDVPNPAVGRISWCAPWLPYVEVLGDGATEYRERGLRDTLAMLERCDALVALGRATSGVSQEIALAHYTSKPVADLIAAGVLPPSTSSDRWWDHHVTEQLVELVAKVERLRELLASDTSCAMCGRIRIPSEALLAMASEVDALTYDRELHGVMPPCPRCRPGGER